MKRIIKHPVAFRRVGGQVYWTKELLEALKAGDAVQIGEIVVGTKELMAIIRNMAWRDVFVRSNGKLDIETVQLVYKGEGEKRKGSYQKPRNNYCRISLLNRAWVPPAVSNLVVLRPKYIGGKKK